MACNERHNIVSYNPTIFNGSCTYQFRTEIPTPGNAITVRRIRLFYRDIGIDTVSFTITGYNEDESITGPIVVIANIGTIGADGLVKMAYAQDFEITAFKFNTIMAFNIGEIISITLVGEGITLPVI